jgi:uncharacterized protein YxeA
MEKKILAGIIIVAVIVVGGISFWLYNNSSSQGGQILIQNYTNPSPRHFFLNLNESMGVSERP